jgi:hypothetical protein
MIEYIFSPGADIDAILRRSLVGRVAMGNVQITASIVDSIDQTQEDRLRMARMQPGVWLANELAMQAPPSPSGYETNRGYREHLQDTVRTLLDKQKASMMTDAAPPDTGPAFSPIERSLAQTLLAAVGPRAGHTIALALSSIAEELEGNSEPHKFLSKDECLSLASAIMRALGDWEGDVPEPAEDEPPPVPEAEIRAAARARAAAVAAGSKPAPIPWQPPKGEPSADR